MSDFKVGDRVRFDVDRYATTPGCKRGEGIVVQTGVNSIHYMVRPDDWPHTEGLYYRAGELTAVSKPLAFRVGDKVASIDGHGKWVGTIMETHPGHKYGWVYRVRYDEAADYHYGSYGRYMEGELQYAPIPDKPKRKFQVGDKVRRIGTATHLQWTEGTVVGYHPQATRDEVMVLPDGYRYGKGCATPDHPGAGTFNEDEFEKVAQSQEFKLRVGDRIRNNLTGREGVIYEAPVARTLKVYDLRPPYRDGVPAVAVEEYEFWHPGTYEHTHRAHKIGPF